MVLTQTWLEENMLKYDCTFFTVRQQRMYSNYRISFVCKCTHTSLCVCVCVRMCMCGQMCVCVCALADMRRDVQDIFRLTPHEKQCMMFSATLSKEIRPV